MEITVRPAQLTDATYAAPLIIDAIGEIANRLTGEDELQAILTELEVLFKRTDNRHSYKNTYVAEIAGEVAGIMVVYGGDQAPTLDNNLEKWLTAKGATIQSIEVEARTDEFYIDTICTAQQFRGQGVGTVLLKYADIVAKEKGYHKVSLSVEKPKERARHLYEKMGFVFSEPWTIIGEEFDHMVKEV
ncbi:N-acetyltransferase family protein [Rummeliibacillus pycnus]|uniref:GNAT family N-acetyltransferase n=1 Tax=Rummeliibacillus pycnus TaxID=101070 RepID=UPI003D2B35D2